MNVIKEFGKSKNVKKFFALNLKIVLCQIEILFEIEIKSASSFLLKKGRSIDPYIEAYNVIRSIQWLERLYATSIENYLNIEGMPFLDW